LLWLALGTFATGTESFMIAAILPKMSADLSVSIQAAGQLMTVFALTYAISSPVLTALTGAFDRRKLLIFSMAAFAFANITAAVASDYWSLVGARVLLAMTAGLYVPSATALAGALVPHHRRGMAMAVITGGTSLAVALGVPLGAIIGNEFGWRMTFAGVAILAAIAFVGLLIGMPRAIGKGLASSSLAERIAVVRQPAALSGLMVTTLWAAGGYTVYTYIAPYLGAVAGLEGTHVGTALFLWGAAAFAGLMLGGFVSDKIGARRVIAIFLPVMAVALVGLSVAARYLSMDAALAPVLIAIIVWGMTAWGFLPAQQTRLIGIAGLKVAPVILSLNASFMYLGFSIGAAIGSLTLTQGGVADLGWVGAVVVVGAFVLFRITDTRARA
jgi:predicted MFS family arabinose efflux permease